MSVDDLAAKFHVTPERLLDWESGERPLTFLKAKEYADKTYIPFGYLFLTEPPFDDLPIPDLRTVDGVLPDSPTAELIDIVKIMQERQVWFKEYRTQHFADPLEFVGRFEPTVDALQIVRDMRNELGLAEQSPRGKWDEYYRTLVNSVERIGVMVMREGYIGHHSRPLNVDEFRGFALVDDHAPLIFINHADSYGARLFTLIHELAHIWIGQTGVSNADSQTHRKEEVLCNAVAAEFLVPEQELLALWTRSDSGLHQFLKELEAHFHVSTWVLARRALDLELISQAEYVAYIESRKRDYERNKDSIVTYYRTKHSQLSDQFAKAVVSEALSGQLMLREAGLLLNMKPAAINEFAKELRI